MFSPVIAFDMCFHIASLRRKTLFSGGPFQAREGYLRREYF
jgi:hypothetical protein